MTGQSLKILFKEDKAYLTPGNPITLKQAGLPDLIKTFNSPAYLIFKVKKYREEYKEIFCEIISYHVGRAEFDDHQQQISNQLKTVQRVRFRDINTPSLLKIKKGIIPVSILPPKAELIYRKDNYNQMNTVAREPFKQNINETFYVPIKNIHFNLGSVSFEHKFNWHSKTIELKIPNEEIREEYDAVKNYFANVLKTKKIAVTVNIEITGNQITSVKANSPEIDKIDKKLIDDVKFEFLKSIKKKSNPEIDQSMFTMDEYFEAFADEEIETNPFYNDDKEFFKDILKISETKHYKHLRLLSSKHAHSIIKLRFIHKPFSFIFLIQGDRDYHIIWETLDTHEATYIWHISNDTFSVTNTLGKIDDIISEMKVNGKTAYTSTTEDPFQRIYHDYSEHIDGFLKWKSELEGILT